MAYLIGHPPHMNTKPKSQFTSLPQEDRTLILKLCSEHDYSEVVEILRKPRSEGGLNIHTSRAALCRFFTNSNPEPTLALLAQFAAAANIRHEQSSNAFLGAIRATVEARILENLRAGKPLSDMERDFRFLKTAEHLYLADAKFRAQHPKTASAAFKSHIQRCADAPDLDFVRADNRNPIPPISNPSRRTSPISIKRFSKFASATRIPSRRYSPPASHRKTSKPIPARSTLPPSLSWRN
jgi:hypothetical protein